MIKRTKGILFTIIFFMIFSSINILSVNAATANVSVSSASVTQNSTVTVTVTVSSNVDISNYHIYFNYNSDILEYQSGAYGGGSGSFQIYSDATTKSDSFKITFKAISAGTASISLASQPVGAGAYALNPADGDIMSLSGGSGSVTVSAPSNASTNNNLSSMVVSAITDTGESRNVTLSPAFSAGVTNYSTTVDLDVSRLSISATPSDSKATTKVEWANLDPGSNKTYIKVTAENGSVKTYTINTTKAAANESTEQTTAASGEQADGMIVDVSGTDMTIVMSLDSVSLPEGYTISTYTYNEKEVPVAISEVKGLMLFYLTNQETGESNFYIYDEKADIFYKYQTIVAGGVTYTIIRADDTVTVPDGYKRTTVTIGDQKIEGWLSDTEQDFCLIYAMNASGDTNVYMYDFKEGTMQRLNDKLYLSLNSNNSDQKEKYVLDLSDLTSTKTLAVFIIFGVLLILCIVLIVMCIVLIRKRKKHKYRNDNDVEEFFDIEEDNDDISLEEAAISKEEPNIEPKEEPAVDVKNYEKTQDNSEEKEMIIAEGVMSNEELKKFTKKCEDILSNQSDSFKDNDDDDDGFSNNKKLSLLDDDDFEILDVDDEE